MTLIGGVMPRLFARGLGLAFVVLVAGASAQSPVRDIDAESGLPTALDIDNELATRIAAEVEIELELEHQLSVSVELEPSRTWREFEAWRHPDS